MTFTIAAPSLDIGEQVIEDPDDDVLDDLLAMGLGALSARIADTEHLRTTAEEFATLKARLYPDNSAR